jgi:hypothetical protein
MQQLLNKLFGMKDDPIEVALQQWIDKQSPGSGTSIIEPLVKAQIKQQRHYFQPWIESGKVNPYDLIGQFVTNAAGDELESGNYHFYRGQLTDLGKCLWQYYIQGWKHIAAVGNVAYSGGGAITEEVAKKEINNMWEIIKMTG